AFTRAFSDLSTSRDGAVAILANSPGEFSREGQRWGGHGAFTRHIVDLAYSGVCKNAEDLLDRIGPLLSQDSSGRQHVWKSGASLDKIELPATSRAASQVAEMQKPSPQTRATSGPSKPDAASEKTSRAASDVDTSTRPKQSSRLPAPATPGAIDSSRTEKTETEPTNASGSAQPARSDSTSNASSKSIGVNSPGAANSPVASSSTTPTRNATPAPKASRSGGGTPKSTQP